MKHTKRAESKRKKRIQKKIERRKDEKILDQTLKDTFPASDATAKY